MKNFIYTVQKTIVLGAAVILPLGAATLYVSASGNDGNSGMSEAMALRTLQKACDMVNPGDTVFVMNGDYNSIVIRRGGDANAWVRFANYAGHTPIVRVDGWNGISFGEGASYVILDGLTIEGKLRTVTLAEGEADYEKDKPNALYNGNGIGIDARKYKNKNHHITIRNCIIRYCCGGGIASCGAGDHIRIENNTVHENGWYMRYAGSGISILASYPTDTEAPADYSQVIVGNRCWSNRTLVKWKQAKRLSDGNGIIVDTLRENKFNGRTLVANNICWNNGGSGIHAFKSDNVDIVGNTTWHNSTMLEYGEIFAHAASNVNIMGNIMVAPFGRKVNYPSKNDVKSTTVVYDFNVYYISPASESAGVTAAALDTSDPMRAAGSKAIPSVGEHDIIADPLFVNANPDPLVADFRIRGTSPAIGIVDIPFMPTNDILGVPRESRDGRKNAGAFAKPAD